MGDIYIVHCGCHFLLVTFPVPIFL